MVQEKNTYRTLMGARVEIESRDYLEANKIIALHLYVWELKILNQDMLSPLIEHIAPLKGAGIEMKYL